MPGASEVAHLTAGCSVEATGMIVPSPAKGQPFEIEADGLLAVCLQHEMDHLMGKVFVEYRSPFKLGRIKTKLLKQQRVERQEAV